MKLAYLIYSPPTIPSFKKMVMLFQNPAILILLDPKSPVLLTVVVRCAMCKGDIDHVPFLTDSSVNLSIIRRKVGALPFGHVLILEFETSGIG